MWHLSSFYDHRSRLLRGNLRWGRNIFQTVMTVTSLTEKELYFCKSYEETHCGGTHYLAKTLHEGHKYPVN